MSFLEQRPFGDPDFVDNPEPRCPCLLLLDTSASMDGAPIAQLNSALVTFKDELAADALAMRRVELALVTFGPVHVVTDFHTPDMFQPPQLPATGDTPMGAAIMQGLDLLRWRKDLYNSNGIAYFRPWIFLITDGAPTDQWQEAAAAVHQGENAGNFSFFAIGVEGADMTMLARLSVRPPLRLQGLRFREFFLWLTKTLKGHTKTRVLEDRGKYLPPPPDWTTPV